MKKFALLVMVLLYIFVSSSCGKSKTDHVQKQQEAYKNNMSKMFNNMKKQLKTIEKNVAHANKSNKKYVKEQADIMMKNVYLLEDELRKLDEKSKDEFFAFKKDMELSSKALKKGVKSLFDRVEKENE